MRKLNEDTLVVKPEEERKEVLPAEIVSGQISDLWTRVGSLKTLISDLRKNYLQSGKVCDILEDMLNSDLTAVGQLELFLHENDYLGDSNTEDIEDAAKLSIQQGEENQAEKEHPEDDEEEEDNSEEEDTEIDDRPEANQLDGPIMDDFPEPIDITDDDIYPAVEKSRL